MKHKAAIAVLGAACISLLATLLVYYRNRSDHLQQHKQAPSKPAAEKHAAGHNHDHERGRQGNAEASAPSTAQRKSSPGWKEAILEQLEVIAARLPDLDTVNVEEALTAGWRLKRKVSPVKVGDQIVALEQYEPSSPAEMAYQLKAREPGEDGFRLISRALIETVLKERCSTEPEGVAADLLAIVTSPDDVLGESQAGRRATTALRWMAASMLRGLPLDTINRTKAELTASNHGDPVLRGAVAGALLAFKPTDEYVRTWLKGETSERALQGMLVELARTNNRTEFGENAGVTMTQNGDNISISAKGGGKSSSYSISGHRLTMDLAELLLRPGFFRADMSASPGDAGGERYIPLRGTKEDGGKQSYGTQKLGDARSLALEAILQRMTPEAIQPLSEALDYAATPKWKTAIIEAIGQVRSSSAEQLLVGYTGDSTRTVSERGAAIRGLMRQEGDGARMALEGLLWDPKPRIRQYAAGSLHHARRGLTENTRKRIEWLSLNESDVEAKRVFQSILSSK